MFSAVCHNTDKEEDSASVEKRAPHLFDMCIWIWDLRRSN